MTSELPKQDVAAPQASDAPKGDPLRAVAFVLVIVFAGVAGWLWMRGEDRAAVAARDAMVQGHLRTATLLRGQTKFADAKAAVDRARELAVEGSEAVRSLVDEEGFAIKNAERAAREARTLAADNARLLRDAVRAPRPPVEPRDARAWQRLDAQLKKLFAQVKLDPDAEAAPAAFAQRFALPEEQEQIAGVLDAWSHARHEGGARVAAQRLLDLAMALDTDSVRRSVRRHLRVRDAEAIREMTHKVRASKVPAATMLVLGRALRFVGDPLAAAQVLDAGIRAYPDHFGLRIAVARAKLSIEPVLGAAAVRNLSAAVALRPDSVPAVRLLGYALVHGVGEADQAANVLRAATLARPKEASLRVVLGDAYLAAGNFDGAIREFRQATQLSPNEPRLFEKFGRVLMSRGKHEEAVGVYRRSVKLNPKSSAAYSDLGGALLERRYHDEAVERLRFALQLDGDNAVAHYRLARALRRFEGGDAEALQHAKKAVVLDAKLVAAHFLVGQLLDAAGDRKGAIDAYGKVLALQPAHGPAVCALALATALEGDSAKALEQLDARLQEVADDHAAHYHRGVVLELQGQRKPAIEALKKSIGLQFRRFDAHYRLGGLLDQEQLFHEARDAYENAVRIDGEHAEAHYRFGNLLRRLGKTAEAMSEFREVLRIDKDHVAAHNRLGDLQFARGELKAATATYRSVIKLRPKDADARFGLGQIYAKRDEVSKAIKALSDATRLEPDHAAAHLLLGKLLEADGRLGRAITEFRTTIRLTPQDATAHYALGNALVRRSKLTEGETALRKAVQLDAQYAEAWCNLGHVLTRLKRHKEALQCIEKGHGIGSARKKWPYPSAEWLAKARAAAKQE